MVARPHRRNVSRGSSGEADVQHPPCLQGIALSTSKAGKIVKISNNPLTLPEPGPARSYVPQSLNNLVEETQAQAAGNR